MCRLYAVVAALFLLLVPPCADTTVDRGAGVAATAHVVHGRSLKRIFDIRTTENHAGVDVPGYMYDLYRDAGNRRYNAIRSIAPRTESLGTYTQLVYDLNALEPTEVVQKVILQLETGPKFRFPKAVNVSVYCVYNRTASRTYLGSASLVDSLDLKNTLGSKLLVGIEQLIVQTDGRARNPSIGLVLYSTTRVDGASEKGHELSEFLYETTNRRRRRRSVIDNEIDIKRNGFADELKRKKKKKKSSRVSKLQAVDTGDTIVFANTDQCRMEKLSLNFADIGWEDWVIYPKGFETNYCAGGCLFPLGKTSKPTNHATVQSLARSFGRLWDIPEPSCVPDTLAPLTLLYMDRANHVLLKSYPDMRVITCACK